MLFALDLYVLRKASILLLTPTEELTIDESYRNSLSVINYFNPFTNRLFNNANEAKDLLTLTIYIYCEHWRKMYENVGTRIPEELLKDIEYLSREEHTDKSKVIRELLVIAVKKRLLDLALKKYVEGKISLGRAAELAQLPLVDFMKITAERKIPVHYSIDSLEEDFKKATKKR